MKKEFSKKITIVNVILTIFIVLLHSNCMVYADENSKLFFQFNYINNVINTILDICVPTFFAISSFLFFLNYDNSKFIKKLKSRLKSLVIPYLIWSIIFLIYTYILLNVPIFSNLNTKDTLMPLGKNIFDIILNNVLLNMYDGPLWYVRILFILVLISPIIYILIVKFKKINVMFILITLLIVFIFQPSYNSLFYWVPIYYLIAYLTINYSEKIIDYKCKIIKFDKFLYLIIILFFLFLNNFSFNKNIDFILYYTFRIISPFFVYLFVQKKQFNINFMNISKNCFMIYCSHFAINVVIKRVIIILIGNNPLFMFLLRFITAFITIVIICLVSNFIRKYFPKLFSVMSGMRGV